MLQKRLHCRRRVPRLPHLHIAFVQVTRTFGTPRRSAVRQQHTYARHGLAQSSQQHTRCTRLAQRHRMNPHQLAARLCRLRINTKPLFYGHTVTRLGNGTARQLSTQQRLRSTYQQVIDRVVKAAHNIGR